MKTAAALLALLLAVPAAAQGGKTKKAAEEVVDLAVAVTVYGPGGTITSKGRVQAQNQLSSKRELKKDARHLTFNIVPVINPNNGKVRSEFTFRLVWGKDGEEVNVQSSYETELGREAVVYDAEGIAVKIKISPAAD